MTPEQALELFDTALIVDHPTVVAARLDQGALRDPAFSAGLPPLFNGLIRQPTRRLVDNTAAESKSALVQRLHGLTPTQQHDLLTELVCTQIAIVLATPAPKTSTPNAHSKTSDSTRSPRSNSATDSKPPPG